MPDEPILRAKAREAILNGRLPTTRPSRMFCSLSVGETCAACGDLVTRGEMKFELVFQRWSKWWSEIRRYHLHPRCFTAWDFERIDAGPPEGRPSTFKSQVMH